MNTATFSYADIVKECMGSSRVGYFAPGALSINGLWPPSWGGFPPALIPFAETESGIKYGYWKHWFTENRRTTIVEFYGQTIFGRPLMAMEIARTFEQFLYIQLLKNFTLSEGDNGDAVALAETFKISDLDWVESASNSTGDDPAALVNHPAFRDDPPHYCFSDESSYPGDFPHPGIEASPRRLFEACGYEIHSRFGNGRPDPLEYRQYISSLSISPPWLRQSQPFPVFKDLLELSDFQGAWLSLNSTGWSFEDARTAIMSLASKACDSSFTRFARAWASLSHEDRMGKCY